MNSGSLRRRTCEHLDCGLKDVARRAAGAGEALRHVISEAWFILTLARSRLRRSIVLALALALCATASTVDDLRAEEVRNPFGVEDLVDPVSIAVQQLAEKVVLPGDAGDRNAPQWAPALAGRGGGRLDGEWFGRWTGGTTGTTRVKVIGDRLFALYTDVAGRMSGKSWLLEAMMLADGRLVGSWIQIGNPNDRGPFVGRIVDDERIDGIWNWDGRERWDFRRRLR